MSETLEYSVYGIVSLVLAKDVIKPLISAVINSKKPTNGENASSEREHKKCTYEVKRNTDELLEMHKVKDHNQVPVWYFPREEMQELTKEMKRLRESLDNNTRRN